MTTSKLLSNTPMITAHDLDVIRDFALEAPWEWRMALQALVDIAEKHLDDDDLVERIDELEGALKEAAKQIETELIAASSKPVSDKLKELIAEMREVVES